MKDSTVADLDNLYTKGKQAKSRLRREWFLNLAFLNGNQWVGWDGQQLFKPRLAANRVTDVDNRILPAVRTEIARMTRNDPVFTVVPNTSDEEDTNASDVGEKVLRYLWKHLEIGTRYEKALWWSRGCCAGFLKPYWDSTLGDTTEVLMAEGAVLPHPVTGQPMTPQKNPEMAQMPGIVVKRVSQGDLRVEVRSPFQMFIDPLAEVFDDAEWVIEESVKSAEHVQRRYGVEIQPDTTANPGLVEMSLGGAGYQTGQGGYKGVKVREYWAKPSVTHPQGRRAVWVTTGGDQSKSKQQSRMLYEDPAPFDPMPYVMFSGIPLPGRLWPTSPVEQLRGPQVRMNKITSQLIENASRVGNPTILASKQAVSDPNAFTAGLTLPGGVSFYDDIGSPNSLPRILEAPNLPEYVVQLRQMTEESMQEISGQHDVSSAQVPPGVTAASAIQLLMEADDTRLGPAIRDAERQLGNLGTKLLKLVARYYTDQRTIRLAGDDGAWEIFDFRGAMLKENTHVDVQAGSSFPQSKAAKQAWVQDLLNFFVQGGQPPTGTQLAKFLKDSEMGGAERLVEELSDNEQQINRENVLLAQGQQLQINSYDDDNAHVAGHETFQKSAKYSQLGPQVQQGFEQHVALHKQRLAQMAQAQAQMAQQAQMQASGQAPEQMQMQFQQQQQQAQMEQAQQAQQMQTQGAQAQQQMALKDAAQAQQQGSSAEQAQQQLHHAEQSHQQKLQHQQELHELRLAQQRAAAQQQRQGANRGNR